MRGPLGFFPFFTSGLYLLMMLVITLRLYKNGNNTESLVTIAMTVLTVISTIMESLFGYDGVINVSGAVLLVFYYIYLVTQQLCQLI